jgi:hypothetical protein
VDAPFVFQASAAAPSAPDLEAGGLPISRANNPVPQVTLVERPPERKGIFGKVKGFFSGLFR